MTAKKLAEKYGVNLMKLNCGKWSAYRGGNGTGSPVVDVASAYNLVELETRIVRALAGNPKC